MNGKELIIVACILGAAAIGLGAIGAHQVKPHLDPDQWQAYKTASQYHIIHALLLLVAGIQLKRNPKRKLIAVASYVIITGMFLFCFPMYTKIINENTWVMYLAPFGGVMLMLGWIFTGISLVNKVNEGNSKD
ncbi:MAG: DUF423 domain-containing protein [Bacteroidetes bacterium]|nr:DUF423 domain-containing protein [Bacteroidota bacterium]